MATSATLTPSPARCGPCGERKPGKGNPIKGRSCAPPSPPAKWAGVPPANWTCSAFALLPTREGSPALPQPCGGGQPATGARCPKEVNMTGHILLEGGPSSAGEWLTRTDRPSSWPAGPTLPWPSASPRPPPTITTSVPGRRECAGFIGWVQAGDPAAAHRSSVRRPAGDG